MVDAKTKLKKNPSARYLTQNSWSDRALVHTSRQQQSTDSRVMGGRGVPKIRRAMAQIWSD